MMLDNLTQDERLLGQVRSALQGLSGSLLELARSDVRFFSDHRHPARQFLDRVTDRSLAYTTEDEPGYARFVESINGAVQTINASTELRAVAFALEMESSCPSGSRTTRRNWLCARKRLVHCCMSNNATCSRSAWSTNGWVA